MDYFLNELSLTKVSNKENARRLMTELILTCKALKSHGFNSLRIADGNVLARYELCDGYSIFDWRNDAEVDREYQTRFRSLATQSPLVPTENEKLRNKQALSEFTFSNNNINTLCLGLGLAYLENTISISFCSSEVWDSPEIELNYLILNEDETYSDQSVNAKHSSRVFHLDYFADWIKYLKTTGKVDNWIPSHNYFPCIEIANQLVENGTWETFYKEAQTLSASERITKYKEVGQKVAERNGYFKDTKITKLNNRTIYAAGYSHGRIYLALDTLHGSFELCDYKGINIGEYGFHGNRLGDGHNIKL